MLQQDKSVTCWESRQASCVMRGLQSFDLFEPCSECKSFVPCSQREPHPDKLRSLCLAHSATAVTTIHFDTPSNFVVNIAGYIGRFECSANECSWSTGNTIQLVFRVSKLCAQEGIHKNLTYVFPTFQFRLNFTGTSVCWNILTWH